MHYRKFTVSRPSLATTTPKWEDNGFNKILSWSGTYRHFRGLAQIDSSLIVWPDGREREDALIRIIQDGFEHVWFFDQYFTPKGLARKAFNLFYEL